MKRQVARSWTAARFSGLKHCRDGPSFTAQVAELEGASDAASHKRIKYLMIAQLAKHLVSFVNHVYPLLGYLIS